MNLFRRMYAPFVGGTGAVGLLIVRLVFGLALAQHGWGKIQHPMEWMGPNAPIPGVFQFLAAFSEFFGGLAVVVGLLTPIASLGIFFTMAFAVFTHAQMGSPWVANGPSKVGSMEPAIGYLVVAIMLMLTGPGTLSLDALLFGRKPSNTFTTTG